MNRKTATEPNGRTPLAEVVGSDARIAVWVKPGSAQNALSWDPWRKRWVVSCTAEAVGGAANRAVEGLLAGWLEMPLQAVRWIRAGSSHAKLIGVEGIGTAEATRRLEQKVRALRPDR